MLDNVARLVQIELGRWVLVAELDAVLVVVNLEDLDVHSHFAALVSLLLFGGGCACKLRREVKFKMRSRDAVCNLLAIQVGHQVLKVVERLTFHEELSVLLHEEGSVLFDFETVPSLLHVLSLLAFLFVSVTTTANLALLLSFVAALAFLLSLIVRLLVDQCLSLGELNFDLFNGRNWALHPWVLQDLVDGEPLCWVQRHHLLEEVFELG